jgi:hypothetical protein
MLRAISIGHGHGDLQPHAIADRRQDHEEDDEMLAAFRTYLGEELGDDAVRCSTAG